MKALPGLDDDAALLRAYGIVRVSGLVGIGTYATLLLASRTGLSPTGLGVPTLLALCWGIGMVGLAFLLDARRAWVNGARKGFLLQLVIGFNVLGALLASTGLGGALLVSYALLAS